MPSSRFSQLELLQKLDGNSKFLDMISTTLVCISSAEFLVSQTPYSMRGLMIGVAYGSVFIFAAIGYGIYRPFFHQPSTWATGIISCES